MKVVHVSPTYFAPESVIGGGERFAEELSRALAEFADVRFVSFGPRSFRARETPAYERVILRNWTWRKMCPFSPGLFRELRGADVIHCHQYYVLPTFLAAWYGHRQGSRVFVTDLGGGDWTPGYQIDQSRWLTGHLPLSEYASRQLPGRPLPHRVTYGGVDLDRYPSRARLEHDGSIVCLGRILPHKGLETAIAALPKGMTLHVVGDAPDASYLEHVRNVAQGRDVRFHLGKSDSDVIRLLQRAMALVHATPVDASGSAGVNELFCLALVEAMACGCPAVAARAASLPEIVIDGQSGVLVPPNESEAIRAAVLQVSSDSEMWRGLSRGARKRVEEHFTWHAVARRCCDAYSELSQAAVASDV